jgi:hypothetical protein
MNSYALRTKHRWSAQVRIVEVKAPDGSAAVAMVQHPWTVTAIARRERRQCAARRATRALAASITAFALLFAFAVALTPAPRASDGSEQPIWELASRHPVVACTVAGVVAIAAGLIAVVGWDRLMAFVALRFWWQRVEFVPVHEGVVGASAPVGRGVPIDPASADQHVLGIAYRTAAVRVAVNLAGLVVDAHYELDGCVVDVRGRLRLTDAGGLRVGDTELPVNLHELQECGGSIPFRHLPLGPFDEGLRREPDGEESSANFDEELSRQLLENERDDELLHEPIDDNWDETDFDEPSLEDDGDHDNPRSLYLRSRAQPGVWIVNSFTPDLDEA